MICLGNTPKKSNQIENLPPLLLNKETKISDCSKKFKKNLKRQKNNTANILSKKLHQFFAKIKFKKENNYINSKNINRSIFKTNNFRTFLDYKLKKKYDSQIYTYNIKKINELIFNIPSRFTANFKDYLLIEEDAEFLKREYHKEEFSKKFKKIFFFYDKYSKTFPNYTILNEGKYIYKNILKKQKMIDELQKIKEEEEEKTISNLMNISNETIFTNNTIESIFNQKDSFWIKNMQNIIYLDENQDELSTIEKINSLIKNINIYEKLNAEKSNKQTIYKKEFKKIRNLSKPLYINQVNPKLVKIKEKINQIKNYRNNYDLNNKSKHRTIESSYNSFSTTINNKSFNNKGILINNEEKKEILKKRIPCPKDLSYKKSSKDKNVEIERKRLSNLSNKHQKIIEDKNQYDSKFSNSMITNKIKNYFKINLNNYERKKKLLNSQKKREFSYNIGSLFNSRKDRCKEFLTDKKLISVFNKYISNRTKPFKKTLYVNTEYNNNTHYKNSYVVNNQYNLNPRTCNTEFYDSKNSYDDNNISRSRFQSNYSLTKNNINISHNNFMNHTFSSMRKNNKNLNKIKKYNKKKNLENSSKNKLYLKSKILKNKNNKNRKSFLNSNCKIKFKFGEKNHLKTFCNARSNTNYSLNNKTIISIENQSIVQKKKNNNEKKIILSGVHCGRNEKFINIKFPCGNTFHSIKYNGKKHLLNK